MGLMAGKFDGLSRDAAAMVVSAFTRASLWSCTKISMRLPRLLSDASASATDLQHRRSPRHLA